ENVITDIMNRLPIRDAMRTSNLASNWRFRWTMLTELVIRISQISWLSKSTELALVAMSSNSHKVGKLITQCPSLEDLCINRDKADARKDVSTTFPCLKTLGFHSIDFANDIKLSFIFEMIFRSPNLQRLEIVVS
nr:hypothetical protein [Tanacetum cinerariifolium]